MNTGCCISFRAVCQMTGRASIYSFGYLASTFAQLKMRSSKYYVHSDFLLNLKCHMTQLRRCFYLLIFRCQIITVLVLYLSMMCANCYCTLVLVKTQPDPVC